LRTTKNRAASSAVLMSQAVPNGEWRTGPAVRGLRPFWSDPPDSVAASVTRIRTVERAATAQTRTSAERSVAAIERSVHPPRSSGRQATVRKSREPKSTSALR
jgi:hypothetical protein